VSLRRGDARVAHVSVPGKKGGRSSLHQNLVRLYLV
jgi:hypothetical protein